MKPVVETPEGSCGRKAGEGNWPLCPLTHTRPKGAGAGLVARDLEDIQGGTKAQSVATEINQQQKGGRRRIARRRAAWLRGRLPPPPAAQGSKASAAARLSPQAPIPPPPHLGVIIQVPEIQAAHPVHAGKERGMHWRPHDVVDIVGIVFKGVERLVVLREAEREA